jgi:hypothetical protein
MSDMTPDEVSEVRLKLAEVEFRAKSDESYLKRLQDDPSGVLKAAGFDDPMVQELTAQLTGDYEQFANRADGCSVCDPWTCWITGCCHFTLVEPGPIA